MATYSKQKLSASTDGKAVKITATSTVGTTVHTATSGTTNFDEIWLYANNNSTSPVVLTVEWGTTTAADGNIIQTIQPKSGLVPIVSGLILQNGLLVTAFADTTAVILITGFVNHIVP